MQERADRPVDVGGAVDGEGDGLLGDPERLPDRDLEPDDAGVETRAVGGAARATCRGRPDRRRWTCPSDRARSRAAYSPMTGHPAPPRCRDGSVIGSEGSSSSAASSSVGDVGGGPVEHRGQLGDLRRALRRHGVRTPRRAAGRCSWCGSGCSAYADPTTIRTCVLLVLVEEFFRLRWLRGSSPGLLAPQPTCGHRPSAARGLDRPSAEVRTPRRPRRLRACDLRPSAEVRAQRASKPRAPRSRSSRPSGCGGFEARRQGSSHLSRRVVTARRLRCERRPARRLRCERSEPRSHGPHGRVEPVFRLRWLRGSSPGLLAPQPTCGAREGCEARGHPDPATTRSRASDRARRRTPLQSCGLETAAGGLLDHRGLTSSTTVWSSSALDPHNPLARHPSLGHRDRVDEVEVVVAHHERVTLRVGDVFLKIDADPDAWTPRPRRWPRRRSRRPRSGGASRR